MNNKCFIKNCTTTRSEGITLFRATQKSGRLEKWRSVIPSQNGELTEDSLICELHFESKYVTRYVEMRFVEDSNQFHKTQVGLTKGAIPSVFDNETIQKKRREIFTTNLMRNKPKIALVLAQDEYNSSYKTHSLVPSASAQSVFASIENVPVLPYPRTRSTNEPVPTQTTEKLSEPICVDLTIFDFDSLKTDMSTIWLPYMWSYSMYRNLSIILINWDFTFSEVVKEIIITSNLDCKVFINKVPITIECLPAIRDLDSLKRIVEIVDLLPITKSGLIRKLGKPPSILSFDVHDFYEAFKNKVKERRNNRPQFLHLR